MLCLEGEIVFLLAGETFGHLVGRLFDSVSLPAVADQVFKVPLVNPRVGIFGKANRGRADGFVLDAVEPPAVLVAAFGLLLFVGSDAGPLGEVQHRVERLGLRLVADAVQVLGLAAGEGLGNRVQRSRHGLVSKRSSSDSGLDVGPAGGVLQRLVAAARWSLRPARGVRWQAHGAVRRR